MDVPGKFTPVQGNIPPQGSPPQVKGSIPVLPIILVLIYIAYLGVMIIGPKFVSQLAEELDPLMGAFWRLIGAGVLFLVFALVIVINLLSKPRPAQVQPPKPGAPGAVRTPIKPVSATQSSKFKPVTTQAVQKKAETLKQQPRKFEDEPVRSQVIIYPVEVEGGIFGDTYIELSQKKVLKLRSMVVEPEYLS